MNLKLKFLLLLFLPSLVVGQNTSVEKKTGTVPGFKKIIIRPGNFSDSIPITLWNELILVKIKINGKEGDFIWDNGFSVSCIDSSFAKEINLSFQQYSTISAVDGYNRKVNSNYCISKASMNIGKVEIKNFTFLLSDIEHIFASTKIKGILGASIINKMNWSFNFDESYVAFSKKVFKRNGIVLKFDIEDNNTHSMKVKLNGYETKTQVDFGSNSKYWDMNTNVYPIFKNNLVARQCGITGISLGGLNDIDTTFIIREKYDYQISDTMFEITPQLAISKNESGLRLGNPPFRYYNVIINSQTNEYILSKRNGTTNYPVSSKTFGLKLFMNSGRIYIASITMNPNNIFAKYQIFDEVIEVNSHFPDYFENVFDLIKFQEELLINNKSLKIKLKNGDEFELIPELDIELRFFTFK